MSEILGYNLIASPNEMEPEGHYICCVRASDFASLEAAKAEAERQALARHQETGRGIEVWPWYAAQTQSRRESPGRTSRRERRAAERAAGGAS